MKEENERINKETKLIKDCLRELLTTFAFLPNIDFERRQNIIKIKSKLDNGNKTK